VPSGVEPGPLASAASVLPHSHLLSLVRHVYHDTSSFTTLYYSLLAMVSGHWSFRNGYCTRYTQRRIQYNSKDIFKTPLHVIILVEPCLLPLDAKVNCPVAASCWHGTKMDHVYPYWCSRNEFLSLPSLCYHNSKYDNINSTQFYSM